MYPTNIRDQEIYGYIDQRESC